MERYYLRCTFCERVMSVNIDNIDLQAPNVQEIVKSPCPLCGEIALRVMGRVEKKNIVRDVIKSACDSRCTNAQGPSCNCVCGCLNHGTQKLIVFSKIVGKLEVAEKEMLNNNEAHVQRIKRMAAAKNSIKVKVITFLNYQYRNILAEAKEKGGYWRLKYEDYYKYQDYKRMLQKIDKIEDLKSIQRKINSLTHLIPQIGGTLDYLEALSLKKEQEVRI